MKKRVTIMVVVSALLCAIVAIQKPYSLPPENDSGQEQPVVMKLEPNIEEITYDVEEPVGVVRAVGLQDTLISASDYGEILPYAAQILGWKTDGTPVYRYALADSNGELVTNAVYASVSREFCNGSLVWLLTSEDENGSKRVSCAAQDGSWTLGPFNGSITIEEDKIFVRRVENSTVTTVYDQNGKIMGQVTGTVASCADDMIVSYETTATGAVWHLNDANSIVETARLNAVHVGAFSDGSATVQLTENEWGFIDAEGTVIKTDATWIDESCRGYALAKNEDGEFGVLDTSGNTTVAFKYIKAVKCNEDLPLYQLWKSEDDCMVISASNGQKLALPKDLNAQELVSLPQTYFAYTNEAGNTVVFDDLDSAELEGSVEFYRQGRHFLLSAAEASFQLIDLREGTAGTAQPYRYVPSGTEETERDSVFTIEDTQTELQGIANNRGRIVLDPVYDSIFTVDGSYFEAVQGRWSGIVDSNGDWIVRTQLLSAN